MRFSSHSHVVQRTKYERAEWSEICELSGNIDAFLMIFVSSKRGNYIVAPFYFFVTLVAIKLTSL